MNRRTTEVFIHSNFGSIIQDYPWLDTPDYTVFRHADNRKWFALIAHEAYQTLKVDRLGETDFINLKSDPDLIEELIKQPGIIPAYHMNKRHWLTILLDGSYPPEYIKHLIELSYDLTASKPRQTSSSVL